MEPKRYRIGELSEIAQVSKRTVHYYIARGLLPSPEGSGLGTLYSDEHLYRIQLIRKWQTQYLPLEEIKTRINALSLEDIKEMLSNNESMQRLPRVHDSHPAPQGISYQRIVLCPDLEIHYSPKNSKASKWAEEISAWFLKHQKEG